VSIFFNLPQSFTLTEKWKLFKSEIRYFNCKSKEKALDEKLGTRAKTRRAKISAWIRRLLQTGKGP
jgi:hypothetical protein